MYFIFSKLLLFLILPLSWVFVLLAISLITKNKKIKLRCFVAGLIVLFIFSNTFLFNQFASRWDVQPYTIKNNATYNCAIILGGFAGGDNNGGGRFNTSADRFIQATLLYKTGKISHILITGGNGSLNPGGFKEATWVKTQLQSLKIPDSAILIEHNSRNTIENARFSKTVLAKSKLAGPFLLVTSAFHMRRALMIFKKEDFPVIAYPCNFMAYSGSYSVDDCIIPDAENLSKWNIYLKELVGYAVNYFNG